MNMCTISGGFAEIFDNYIIRIFAIAKPKVHQIGFNFTMLRPNSLHNDFSCQGFLKIEKK